MQAARLYVCNRQIPGLESELVLTDGENRLYGPFARERLSYHLLPERFLERDGQDVLAPSRIRGFSPPSALFRVGEVVGIDCSPELLSGSVIAYLPARLVEVYEPSERQLGDVGLAMKMLGGAWRKEVGLPSEVAFADLRFLQALQKLCNPDVLLGEGVLPPEGSLLVN